MNAKSHRLFQNWNGQIDLVNLRDKLNKSLGNGDPLDLETRQDVRDIIEFLAFDDVVFDAALQSYLPQQTENNPVRIS